MLLGAAVLGVGLLAPTPPPGVRPAEAEALERRCAEGGGHACFALAQMHSDGRGVPRDTERATDFYRRGCTAEHLEACLRACLGGSDSGCSALGYGSDLAGSLRSIAAEAEPSRRRTAVALLEDPVLLAAVVWAEGSSDTGKAALDRLARLGEGDARTREWIASSLARKDPYIRLDAVRRIRDPQLLRALALSDPSHVVRQAAVERLTDQGLLHWIARSDRDMGTLRSAVHRIDDPAVLAAIAKRPQHPWNSEWVGEAAVARIADPAVLADLARTAGLWRVRHAAVAALKDESLLLDLAWNAGHTDVGQLAVAKLTDQTVLAAIARTHADGWVRVSAVRRLQDQVLLEELARTDRNGYVREAAVNRIAAPAVIFDLVWHAAHLDVREAAVRRVADRTLITDVAQKHPDPRVRIAALARQEDATLLDLIARTDPDAGVRKAAVGVLRSTALEKTAGPILGELARSAPDAEVRAAAVWAIHDESVVRRIARSDPDPVVRRRVTERIAALRAARQREGGGGLTIGAQYGWQGPTLSAGLVVGHLDRCYSHTIICFDSIDGLLIQGELGARSSKASLGFARMVQVAPPLNFGLATKLSYLDERRGGSGSGSPYVGVEADFGFLVKLSLGVFKGVGDDKSVRLGWGLGIGF